LRKFVLSIQEAGLAAQQLSGADILADGIQTFSRFSGKGGAL
jgi:hypothetical protein